MVLRRLASAAGFLGSVEGNGSLIGEHESRFSIFLCVLFSVLNDSEVGCCDVGLPSCASAIECGISMRYIFLSWKRIAVSSCIVLLILVILLPWLVGDGENKLWIAVHRVVVELSLMNSKDVDKVDSFNPIYLHSLRDSVFYICINSLCSTRQPNLDLRQQAEEKSYRKIKRYKVIQKRRRYKTGPPPRRDTRLFHHRFPMRIQFVSRVRSPLPAIQRPIRVKR